MAHTVADWLNEYGTCHRHPLNKRLHWICVPLIALSVVGFLWSVPVPAAAAAISPFVNWAALFLLAVIVYYLTLSTSLAIGMAVFSAILMVVTYALSQLSVPLWLTSLIIFVLAWIGQFVGHHYEGARPAFFKDLQFLLIGPLWLMAHLYARLGWADATGKA
ncbi:MAG TPA: Mpo1-like protein [Gammaproteobacteria bacterium]|nr:Mpo1-like protein [Gammaproteobacteria bacterium]